MDLMESKYGVETPGGVTGYQDPPVKVVSPYERSLGDNADTFFRKYTGIKLDPWQVGIFQDLLGKRSNGLWASRVAGMVIARQNGKTELAAARIILGLFFLKERLIIYTSHRNDLAKSVFERVEDLIIASPALKRRVKHIRHTNGEQSVKTTDGKEVLFKTRKKNSGRGFSCDCLIVDEAMDCDRQFVRDAEKATSARLNPQIIYMGSAGTQESLAFGDKRKRALGKTPGLISWFEWSMEKCDDECDDDCDVHVDPHSVEAYRLTNPAYGIRITHETIEEEWLDHQEDLEGFYIERLSIGDWPSELESFKIISKEAWESAQRKVNPVGQLIFAVSMSPNRTDTVITAVGMSEACLEKDPDGNEALCQLSEDDHMVIHVLPDSARGGTAWVFDRLVELYEKWKPYGFAIDSRGQASTLIEDLDEKRIPVYSPSSLEYAQACAEFSVGVTGTKRQKPYIHHIGDSMLTKAVAGADERKLSGLWAWARANERSNIVPLEAATLGVWGLKKAVKESSMSYDVFRPIGGGR